MTPGTRAGIQRGLVPFPTSKNFVEGSRGTTLPRLDCSPFAERRAFRLSREDDPHVRTPALPLVPLISLLPHVPLSGKNAIPRAVPLPQAIDPRPCPRPLGVDPCHRGVGYDS